MNTPLLNGLTEHILKNRIPFHTPGHKGGRLFPKSLAFSPAQMDLTEVPGLDNLHAPEGIIREAQDLAARAFHSDACFFLVNGSTSGIHIMMMAAFQPGDRVLVPRNCHKSVWGGLILSGAEPVFLQPEYDEDRCLLTHVTPEAVALAIRENPEVKGMIITNPDYYGLCPRLEQIGSLLKRHGMKLLVDEAHGSHLIFHPDLPLSAAHCGADAWVQSAHKTLPALTQSSYLHVRAPSIQTPSDRISSVGTQSYFRHDSFIESVTRHHRLLQTTSPSYLLMASLDWARAYMEEEGKEALDRLLENLEGTKKELRSLGFRILGNVKRPEIYETDPTRLVLDVSELGFTGFEADALLGQAGVQVEMSDSRRLVLVCTAADQKESFAKLVDACRFLSTKQGIGENKGRKLTISREIPKQMLSPKEAFSGNKERIPLGKAAGRICGEPIGPYPPGIPSYYPGELMTASGVEELLENQAQGADLFGLSEDGLVSVIVTG